MNSGSRRAMHRCLVLLALLVRTQAQATPPGSVDYSCLHAVSQRVNCDANLNSYYGTKTDVYDGQYSAMNSMFFAANVYLYNAYDIPYYDHTATKCDIDSLVSRPYRMFEEVLYS